ncbi:MAG: ATP-grasp domain-containing protein, partial [Candidatus Methanospirareceae archaeon]
GARGGARGGGRAEEDFEAAVERLAKRSDAGIVIAPDETLCELTKVVEENTVNLGCPSECVKICADKMQTTKILEREGIPVPRLVSESREEEEREREGERERGREEERKRGREGVRERVSEGEGVQSYVKKPRYGCASENVFVLNWEERGEEGGEASLGAGTEDFIVTEFVKGEAVSSSVIAGAVGGGSSVLPLTVNKQFVRQERGREGEVKRLRYEGGVVPYFVGRSAEKQIKSTSEKVATTLNCRGYVGIDFVLGEEDGTAYVVDVNPRPTTSVVGVAEVLLNYEFADLLWRARFGTLPAEEEVKTGGEFILDFSKESFVKGE